jgi:hypothetical protein
MSGGRLWVDMTHWYYGVYPEPFEAVSRFLRRHSSDWQESAGIDGLVWASQSGSLPKTALASLIFASSELIAARTLPLAQRLRIIRWLNRLWMEVAFTGLAPTSRAGLAIPITSGSVDAKVKDTLKQQIWFPLDFVLKCALTNITSCMLKTIEQLSSFIRRQCISLLSNICSGRRKGIDGKDSPSRRHEVGFIRRVHLQIPEPIRHKLASHFGLSQQHFRYLNLF